MTERCEYVDDVISSNNLFYSIIMNEIYSLMAAIYLGIDYSEK